MANIGKYIGRALLVSAALSVVSCLPMDAREHKTTVEGTYDFSARYDMSVAAGALQSTAGSWVSPDDAIVNSILGLVKSGFGEDVAAAVSSNYGSTLRRDVRGYMSSSSPSWVMGLSSQVGLVDDQLKTVDIRGSWHVAAVAGQDNAGQENAGQENAGEENAGEDQSGLGREYEVTQMWSGISVFKNPACRSGGSLLCEQFHISTETLLDSEYPLEIVSSRARVRTTGENLNVAAHNIELNYGRLGLYLLINQLFPDKAAESIGARDIALAAVNCRGLAGRLTGKDDVLGWDVLGVRVGLSLNQLVGSCEDSVFGSVNGLVDKFNLPLQMNLSGNARLVDSARQGQIDRIDQGKMSGAMTMPMGRSETRQGSVQGDFTAFRVGSFE